MGKYDAIKKSCTELLLQFVARGGVFDGAGAEAAKSTVPGKAWKRVDSAEKKSAAIEREFDLVVIHSEGMIAIERKKEPRVAAKLLGVF